MTTYQCDCDKYKPDCRCHEIPAAAMYIEPVETFHRPNPGDTIELRLARIEANQRTILDNQAMHGAAIREIVAKLMAQGLWIAGPEPEVER